MTIHASCQRKETADTLGLVTADRRLAKAGIHITNGGVYAAIALYQNKSTPNLIIIETSDLRSPLLSQLDHLAEHCDPGTRVIIIGHHHDVILYRELLRRGVADYLVAPLTPLQI